MGSMVGAQLIDKADYGGGGRHRLAVDLGEPPQSFYK